MSLAPADYDFGNASNYSFATTITCGSEDARRTFAEAFGHMLNFNHEQAIACYMKTTEWTQPARWHGGVLHIVFPQITTGRPA